MSNCWTASSLAAGGQTRAVEGRAPRAREGDAGQHDADTQGAFDAARAKLKEAGVVFVDVEMPKLMELNDAIGFPLALYEAYDDVLAYLKKTGTGLTIDKMAEQIASPT